MTAEKTTVEKTCFNCKQTKTFHLDTDQYAAWKGGALIQNVLGYLSADDREKKKYEASENDLLTPDKDFDASGRKFRKQDFSKPFSEAPECGLEEANLISSTTDYRSGTYHKPVLDFDFPCRLIPSTTDGHFHLYIDFHIEKSKYFNLLDAMQQAGLLQKAYVEHAKQRGYTAVRPPWVRKKLGEQNDSGEGH